MIERTIKKYLDRTIDHAVYMEVPDNAPANYVTLEKVGMSKDNHICKSTFAIQSVADRLYDAIALDEQVRDAMDRIVSEDEIISCSLNSSYNFPDLSRKKCRYQAVFDITHY